MESSKSLKQPAARILSFYPSGASIPLRHTWSLTGNGDWGVVQRWFGV